MNELLQGLDRAHQGLQHLNLEPTRNNMAILLDALQVLEQTYAFVKDADQKSAEDSEDGNNHAD